jgi:hypothetical protein
MSQGLLLTLAQTRELPDEKHNQCPLHFAAIIIVTDVTFYKFKTGII